jgi:hypothetical protein
VSLSGLTLPITTTGDRQGNVFVLEKAGRVKTIAAWVGVPTRVVLDISNNVAFYGDHGATSILFDEGFLYISYSKVNPTWGPDCKDYGQMDGRPRLGIRGCALYGRLSRWAMDADGSGSVAGQEEVLFDTEAGNKACVQFSTHSGPACVIKHNGSFFISLGDGAALGPPASAPGQPGGAPKPPSRATSCTEKPATASSPATSELGSSPEAAPAQETVGRSLSGATAITAHRRVLRCLMN